MRAKTYFSERPAPYEIKDGDAGNNVVFFRQNIEEIQIDEDGTQYTADEYTLTVAASASIEKRIAENYQKWLEKAMQEDYDKAASAVRKKRDELIAKTDYLLTADYPISDEERDAVKSYRQALRDIPEQDGFPYDVTFPEKPKYVK